MVAEDSPYAFLFERLVPYAFDQRIANVTTDANGREQTRKLETPPSGEVFHSFREWRKLSQAPGLVR
jgi:hypothetical protein